MPLRAALALLAFFAVGAPAAAAKPQDLGRFPGQLLTDEKRFLVAVAPDGALTVRDLKTGRRSRPAVPEGCRATGAGAATLIFDCAPADPATILASGRTLDLRTGEVRLLPDFRHAQYGGMESPGYRDIGRRWIEVDVRGYHYRRPEYLDRATGQLVGDPTRGDPTIVADLDGDRLLHRLCSPLRRPSVEYDDSPGSGAGSLVRPGGLAAWATPPDFHSDGELLLQRCGQRPKPVALCAATCDQLVLDGRTLAWRDGKRVRARSVRGGRTRSFGPPGWWQLALVRGALYGTRGDRLYRIRR